MSDNRSLEPPSMAAADSRAIEVLRVWAAADSPQHLVLRTTWKDRGAWGLLLGDVARHVANAYAKEGQERAMTLKRIRELWDGEFDSPPDEPKRKRHITL